MTSHSSLIYSAAAVRRILGLRSSTPVRVQEFFRVIWVWVQGKRPTFISKSVLKAHFVDYRKTAAADLQVQPVPGDSSRYVVSNPRHSSTYTVECLPTHLECSCEDYQQQYQQLGKGCCKHGYAVLNSLGFSSLRSYSMALADQALADQPKRLPPAAQAA